MIDLRHLFDNNKNWAKGKIKKDNGVFTRLSKKQTPKYLWIGCADSRVPPNEILGLDIGDIFVHRNIANMVPPEDLSSHSVLQYGVEHLNIEHVIICGHYGCEGVKAALGNEKLGLIDHWLGFIRNQDQGVLEGIKDPEEKCHCFVELNALYQVKNICSTKIAQDRWIQGKKLSVHGWVYDISTGLLRDLNCTVSSKDQYSEVFKIK